MPPACQADESLNSHFDRLLTSSIDVEVGLLIGRNSCANKDLIVLLVATSSQDRPPVTLQNTKIKSSKKAKQPQAEQASLDLTAIIEHAAQVAAMMPGGLAVVGIYLYGPESIFTSTTQQLCKVLEGLRSMPGTDADKLLFVSSSARRFLCKHWPAGTASTTALPICTFQLAPTLANMQCMTCRHDVNISWPTASCQTAAEQVEAAALAECQRIQQGTGLIQGRVATPNATAADLALAKGVELELLCALPGCNASRQQQSKKEESVNGRILLKGVLHGRAMVNKKDTLATAAELIKADLVGSLQARLDILMAEAEQDGQTTESDSQPSWLSSSPGLSASSIQLPLRVFFPAKGISLSDYQATGELASDAAARADTVLGPGFADLAQAECPEGKQSSVDHHQQIKSWSPCEHHMQNSLMTRSMWTSQCSIAVIASSALVTLTAAMGVLYIGSFE